MSFKITCNHCNETVIIDTSSEREYSKFKDNKQEETEIDIVNIKDVPVNQYFRYVDDVYLKLRSEEEDAILCLSMTDREQYYLSVDLEVKAEVVKKPRKQLWDLKHLGLGEFFKLDDDVYQKLSYQEEDRTCLCSNIKDGEHCHLSLNLPVEKVKVKMSVIE